MNTYIVIYSVLGLFIAAVASSKYYEDAYLSDLPEPKQTFVFFGVFWLFFIVWPIVAIQFIVKKIKTII